MTPETAQFHQATAGTSNFSLTWQQVLALILAMAKQGLDKATIEAEVDALIMGTALPPWLKPFMVGMANAAIDSILAGVMAPPPVKAA